MTLNAIDLSNHSGPLSDQQAQGLKDAGIRLVLVQTVDPPAGFPKGVTRQQIEACLNAGLVVDAYVWLWFDLAVEDIRRKLTLLDGLSIRRLWLDVEDQAAAKYDTLQCETLVLAALETCDRFTVTGANQTGIYSGRWYWADPRYMGNTTRFSDLGRELWDALYDYVPDASVGFVPYGGWRRVAIKQFQGTATLAGVPNVDLNALSDAELAKLTTTPEEPMPDSDPAWQAKKDAVVQAAGELLAVSDQLVSAGKRRYGPVRADVLALAEAVRARAQKILA